MPPSLKSEKKPKPISRKRVLIADESITIQKMVLRTLDREGIDVVTASDGNDALTKVKTLRPDLVLADLHLKQMDGVLLCDTIRGDSSLTSTKVILLKSNTAKGAELKINNSTADEILTKPFDAAALQEVVIRVLTEDESTVVRMQPMADEKEEVTSKVHPQDFKQPVNISSPVDEVQKEVERQIREWIENKLPKLAEKLIKEEIARLTKSS